MTTKLTTDEIWSDAPIGEAGAFPQKIKKISVKRFDKKYVLNVLKILAKQQWLEEDRDLIKVSDIDDTTCEVVLDNTDIAQQWGDVEASDQLEAFVGELDGISRLRRLLKDF